MLQPYLSFADSVFKKTSESLCFADYEDGRINNAFPD